MAVTLRRAGPQLLASAGTDLYTAPAATTAYLRAVVLVNSHSSAVTVTVYILATGGTVENAKKITSAISIPIGETIPLDLFSMPLAATERLHLVPSVDAVVTATVTLGEETA